MMNRHLLSTVGLLVLSASVLAIPEAVVLKNKPNNDNYGDCDGVYSISSHTLNGKAVYIRDDGGRFIGWDGNVWVATHTYWLQEVLRDQGYFGGYQWNDNSNVAKDWDEYESLGVAHYEIELEPKPLDEIPDQDKHNNGDCGGVYAVHSEIVNNRPVYLREDGKRFIGWDSRGYWLVYEEYQLWQLIRDGRLFSNTWRYDRSYQGNVLNDDGSYSWDYYFVN